MKHEILVITAIAILFIAGYTPNTIGYTPNTIDKSSLTVFDTFDLTLYDNDWVVGYSDYPQDSDPAFYELSSGVREIPFVDGTTGYGMYVQGNNHSDDLFMFMKKQVTGLKPNAVYSAIFRFDIATNVPEGMMGIGGSPGESVYVKIGASTVEPSNVIDDQQWLRLNIDKGNQASGGKDMLSVGHIASPNAMGYETFAIKSFDTSAEDFTVTSDDSGNAWIIIGTDSGFEGITTIYYSSVEVRFEEEQVPAEDFSNEFFMTLTPGLNMISAPLKPEIPYTARSFAEATGATVVIRYNEALGRFKGFSLDSPGDGFTIEGGKGYIVNVPGGGTVKFTGAAWTNEPPVDALEAPPVAPVSDTWAFMVSGWVLDGDVMSAIDGDCTTVVKNLHTGEIFTEEVDASGYFAVAWADLNRRTVIGSDDRIEVAVVDGSGKIASGPFIHDITMDSIRNAVMNVRLKLGNIIPEEMVLLQNYPNPFNPETWIPYHLSDTSPVVIRIHNASGQLVRTLDMGYKEIGIYVSRSRAAYWDGKNESGESVASGIYFYSIQAGEYVATKKMTVTR